MFRVNNKDTRMIPLALMSLLLTNFTPYSTVYIVSFEEVYVGWVLNAVYMKLFF